MLTVECHVGGALYTSTETYGLFCPITNGNGDYIGKFPVVQGSTKTDIDAYLKTYSKTIRKHQHTVTVKAGKDAADTVLHAISVGDRVDSRWSVRSAVMDFSSKTIAITFAFSNEEALLEFFLRFKTT
jgi:hypothetical protein